MEWKLALEILIPLFALMGWIYHRVDKKFDNADTLSKSIINELKDIRKDLQNIDVRLARVEGRMDPFYWHPEVREKK